MVEFSVIGHKAIVSHFSSLVDNTGLSQAYCLVGAHSLGKRVVANITAARLLGAGYQKVESHPDYFLVRRMLDEKSGVAKTEIAVAQARSLRARLREKSWGNGYRVAIVDEAETLSTEAANALLKIVEEPPEKTVLFFLVDRVDNIPATIRSRTEVFYFSLVSDTVIVDALVTRGVTYETAEKICRVSWGRPGRALDLAADAEFFSRETELTNLFGTLLTASAGARNVEIEKLTEKKDGTRVAEEIAGVLDAWLMAGRGKLLDAPENKSVSRVIDYLHEAKAMLKQNVNPRLILENIFLTH